MTRKPTTRALRAQARSAQYRAWVGEAPPAYGEAVARVAAQLGAIAPDGRRPAAVIAGVVAGEAQRLQREHPELWPWFAEHGAAWRAHKPGSG